MVQNYPKTLLFLGSGASLFAGYRTFETFPDLIFNNETRMKESLPPLHPTTSELLHEIEQQLKIDRKPTTHDNFLCKLNDYKSLWKTLSVDGVLKSRFVTNTKLWGDFSYFDQTTEDAITDITTTTIHHYSQNRVKHAKRNNLHLYQSFKRIYSLYEKIAFKNNPDKPFLPIYTTNYDTLLEDLHFEFHVKKRSIPFINGIKNCCQEGECWNISEYKKRSTKQHGLHLNRLHGCVCWYYSNHSDNNVYFHRRDCMQQDIKNLCAMFPGRQGYIGIDPHGYGFRQFYKDLMHCKCILFIGFSFRDSDIMILLLAANKQRKRPFKIIMVDPVLHNSDVMLNLRMTANETQFPVRIPSANDIVALEAKYGFFDVDDMILNAIKRIS